MPKRDNGENQWDLRIHLLTTYAIHINRNIILQLLTACYACRRVDVSATHHLDLRSNTIGCIDKNFGELFKVNVLHRVVYMQNTVRPHMPIDYDEIVCIFLACP